MKKKIYIPHLHYLVMFYSGKDVPKKIRALSDMPNFTVTEVGTNKSIICIKTESKNENNTIAHELIHVLRNIAIDKDIDFKEETEHFAYLMQWLMNECTGYKYC